MWRTQATIFVTQREFKSRRRTTNPRLACRPTNRHPPRLRPTSTRSCCACVHLGPTFECDNRTARWGDGDRVPCNAFGAPARREEPRAAEHRAQHHPHFEKGEPGADAAPWPAAERDPVVCPGAAVEEAFGSKRERVGIQVGTAMHECD